MLKPLSAKLLGGGYGFYGVALMRNIDPSLPKLALSTQQDAKSTLNYTKAKQQHSNLAQEMEKCGLKVIHLASSGLADSVFIEDTAVVVGNRVLITKPGAPSRQPETLLVKQSIEQLFPGIQMSIMGSTGALDGGDVMFTGHELVVGETSRTNLEGITALKDAFPGVPVSVVKLSELESGELSAPLHLKSFCSMIGDGTVIVGGGMGKALASKVLNQTTHFKRYKTLYLPDMEAANCLYINNTIIRRSDVEFPKSAEGWRGITTKQVQIEADELGKVDGALSCCSLLFPFSVQV
ncbi:hypothetical protein EON65_43990 [archaeon]|nr:MAG: hypothetical protein EON65_43990 [archaeon]